MNSNEKRLLRIMLIIFLVYALPFEIVPRAYNFYKNHRQTLEKLQDDTGRYQKLAENAQLWQTQHQQAVQKRDDINASLLSGNTRELVGAGLQKLLKELAKNAGVTVKSFDLQDFSRTREWVLATQAMQFETTSPSMLNFLDMLNKTKEKLAVVKLEIRGNRNILTGTIKVMGFSRLPTTETTPEKRKEGHKEGRKPS